MTQESKILIGIGIVSIVIITIAAFAFGGSTAAKPTEEVALSKEEQASLVREKSHKIAAKEEKVVIVEFGDFQCPACANAYPVVEKLMEEYGDNVSFVFRQYPLPMHEHAKTAALAAEAAGEQGKFFEMYRLIYDNQDTWANSGNAQDEFMKYAKELKLDEEQFTKALEKAEHAKTIENDIADGNALGVNATPTFYINGVKQVGGTSYDEFKAKIEALLKESK